jgi:uncharacterized DUF497 family protein
VYYTYSRDPKKAASNVKKHGVSFVEAISLFADRLPRCWRTLDPERAFLVGQSEKRRVC